MLEVVIDPGELFGAGTHPTTQLCLELLLELEPAARCATGAPAAASSRSRRRGSASAPVDAVEAMPDGLEAIARNAAANGVSVRTHWLNLARGRAMGADRHRQPHARPALGDRRRSLSARRSG